MTKAGRLLALAAALAATVAIGCGDDETTSEETASIPEVSSTELSVSTVSEQTATETDSVSDLDAIEATVEGWLLEGGCERMTANFLEEQTFDDDPKSACETFEAQFTPPAYGADEIETDITYENDKAEVVVGSEGIDVESVYHLVKEGDTWKIDSAELE